MRHKIAITGLRVFAHHGVFDFERQNGQDFYIDAAIWIDGDKAAFTDDLNNTAHYGDLAKGLVELTKNDPVDLLETLAQRLLDYALNFGGGKVLKAKITIHKPGAPIPYEFDDVSITVKATRTS
jgi:dihydroneopterin aldolase